MFSTRFCCFVLYLKLFSFQNRVLFKHISAMVEAVAQRDSVKCVLRNSAQFTGKHLCQSLFFNNAKGLRPAKNRLWHRCFSVNFAKFVRKPFLTEHLRWILRQWVKRMASGLCYSKTFPLAVYRFSWIIIAYLVFNCFAVPDERRLLHFNMADYIYECPKQS